MACICSQYITYKNSDSRTLFSCNAHRPQKQNKSIHVINYMLTSNIQSLQEDLKPWPCHIDQAIAQSICQGLSLRYSCKDLTLG